MPSERILAVPIRADAGTRPEQRHLSWPNSSMITFVDDILMHLPTIIQQFGKTDRKKKKEKKVILHPVIPKRKCGYWVLSLAIAPYHTLQNLVAVALAAEILVRPVEHLEGLVQETPVSAVALQNLLAAEAAAPQSQGASAAGTPQAAAAFHIGAVGAVGIRLGVGVSQEAPVGEEQVAVDAASVADAEAAGHLRHGHPFDAGEALVESHLFDLDHEVLLSPFAYLVAV